MADVKAEHQGPRRRAAVQIIVNGLAGKGGEDVTSKLHPYLISVQVIDTLEGDHDQCNIELDDRNAELQLPPDNVTLQVAMGWSGWGPTLPDRGRSSAAGGQGEMRTDNPEYAQQQAWGGPGMAVVFSGNVSSVESGFGRRGGGRRVWIEGTSGNVKSKAKEVQHVTAGEGTPDDSATSSQGGSAGTGASPSSGSGGTGGDGEIPLQEFMDKLFKESGLKVKLSPEMAKLKRKAWGAHQSPQDWAKEFARLNNGHFKIANGIAMMIQKGEAVNADGDAVPLVEAVWGVNLIGWRIKPYAGRPQFVGAQARFFDFNSAAWKSTGIQIGGTTPFGGADAILREAAASVGKTEADQANAGGAGDSKARRGTGWVLINGEPEAKAGFFVTISKARPGVDGKYLITEVEHNYQRGVGFTTRMNVQYPEPTAGEFGWKNDPGKFVAGQINAPIDNWPPQPDDPNMDPNAGTPISEYVPGSSPIDNFWNIFAGRPMTAAEKAMARQWYINRNLMVPLRYR